jgi:lipoprotein-releasing system permease protein
MYKPWVPFEWIVAIRFLREGRMQTVFILVGVAIGVGVIVFMSALLAGLQGNFIARVLSAQAHIQLLPPKETTRTLRPASPGEVDAAIVQPPLQRLKSMDQWQSLVTDIRHMPDVTVVSPVVSGSALAVRGSASRAISLTGVEPEGYFQIVNLPEKIVRGTPRLT